MALSAYETAVILGMFCSLIQVLLFSVLY
jgi:hypothetical protein